MTAISSNKEPSSLLSPKPLVQDGSKPQRITHTSWYNPDDPEIAAASKKNSLRVYRPNHASWFRPAETPAENNATAISANKNAPSTLVASAAITRVNYDYDSIKSANQLLTKTLLQRRPENARLALKNYQRVAITRDFGALSLERVNGTLGHYRPAPGKIRELVLQINKKDQNEVQRAANDIIDGLLATKPHTQSGFSIPQTLSKSGGSGDIVERILWNKQAKSPQILKTLKLEERYVGKLIKLENGEILECTELFLCEDNPSNYNCIIILHNAEIPPNAKAITSAQVMEEMQECLDHSTLFVQKVIDGEKILSQEDRAALLAKMNIDKGKKPLLYDFGLALLEECAPLSTQMLSIPLLSSAKTNEGSSSLGFVTAGKPKGSIERLSIDRKAFTYQYLSPSLLQKNIFNHVRHVEKILMPKFLENKPNSTLQETALSTASSSELSSLDPDVILSQNSQASIEKLGYSDFEPKSDPASDSAKETSFNTPYGAILQLTEEQRDTAAELFLKEMEKIDPEHFNELSTKFNRSQKPSLVLRSMVANKLHELIYLNIEHFRIDIHPTKCEHIQDLLFNELTPAIFMNTPSQLKVELLLLLANFDRNDQLREALSVPDNKSN